ncbi:hypothetical protein H7J87_15400 [Mycolicibacterium wolinskyi]|uniref:Uncharacterized protein n=1 Tax=Mycolicibacterium wolinskyi TaxID=59750 RepID=A0A1X2F8A1_9MYCO|nr:MULTISPECIES: hypothetical protein [Mycolicibacterium]MCV7286713.1 hypothetical protein [Mycolicibacterium wolinskyi]MCV7293693.1 hypothetical protein [Mycolicibacterium goodii]ORX14588.1 hypothetical protein AWC31_25740 [Mycolicibacterium wolinskyi]
MNLLYSIPGMIISTSVSVIVAALLTYGGKWVRDRAVTRRERRQILDDQDLADRLPVDSTARKHLEAAIQERVIALSYRSAFSTASAAIWGAGLVMAALLALQILVIADSDVPNKMELVVRQSEIMLLMFVVIEAIFIATAVWDRNAITKRRATYFTTGEYPNIFDVERSAIRRALKRRVRGVVRAVRSFPPLRGFRSIDFGDVFRRSRTAPESS